MNDNAIQFSRPILALVYMFPSHGILSCYPVLRTRAVLLKQSVNLLDIQHLGLLLADMADFLPRVVLVLGLVERQ